MLERITDRAITRDSKDSMGYEPTYSGVTSFLRRRYTKDLTGVDVAVSGVALDTATTNRPGARFGPRAIRAASTNMAWFGGPGHWKMDPFETLSVVDYGDCFFDPGKPHEIVGAIEAHATEILDAGATLLTLGGDHFIAYPLLRAYHKKYGPLSLVHFDAHCDTWREDEKRIDHGTMFFHAAQEKLVDPEHSVQIGLRTHNDETHGFNILDGNWVQENGPQAVIDRVKKIVGNRKAYLTFDIDCLDPAYAPGTGTPVCGGLTTWQAQRIIRGLVDIDFVGMDLVEVAPAYDVGEISALAGASLCLDYLCLLATRRQKK
jgi:agmatinase